MRCGEGRTRVIPRFLAWAAGYMEVPCVRQEEL